MKRINSEDFNMYAISEKENKKVLVKIDLLLKKHYIYEIILEEKILLINT